MAGPNGGDRLGAVITSAVTTNFSDYPSLSVPQGFVNVAPNPATGDNLLWQMDGATRLNSTSVTNMNSPDWSLAATADFDGDGKADHLWRQTTTG